MPILQCCRMVNVGEFPVSYRRDIRPDILQVDALRIHRVTVAAIILHLAATMPACLDRCADAPECFGLPLRVVEQAVMAWMEPPRNGETGGNLDSNPVAEVHLQRSKVGRSEERRVGKEGRSRGS